MDKIVALEPRDMAFVEVMLHGWPQLKAHLRRTPDGEVVIQNENEMGSGAEFIVDAFLSLHGHHHIRLGAMTRLDPKNRALFLHALAAWLLEE